MSGRWFRFYADAMRNPKVARLTDKQFRLWVQLLAVASENDGKIPSEADLKHMLNRRLDHLLTGVKELLSIGLIDRLEVGYEPHNWNKFQYKSDTSNERVAKHRAKRNVTVTAPETETEAETDTENNNYVFDGRIVKLEGPVFCSWEKNFPDLDLRAALQSRDDWLASEAGKAGRKNWFMSTSNWLATKQREARTATKLQVGVC